MSDVMDRKPREKLTPAHFTAKLYVSLWDGDEFETDTEVTTRELVCQHTWLRMVRDGCPRYGIVFDRPSGGDPLYGFRVLGCQIPERKCIKAGERILLCMEGRAGNIIARSRE